MNNFFEWLPVDGWSRWMVDALWQSTILATLGLLAARWLTRQSTVRAWILLLMLVACLLVPLASMAARSAGWTLLTGAATTPSREPVAVRATIPYPLTPVTAPLQSIEPISTSGLASWPVMFGIVWTVASSILAIRLLLSSWAVARMVRSASVSTEPLLLAAAADAARRLGIHRTPGVLISGGVQTPMVLALGRPRLVVPQPAGGAAEIDWSAAFTHELAHVVRGDGWTRVCIELIMIAIPLQPLMWLARRQFFLASEEACDDWAVASGSDPVSLAETLTNWIDNRSRISAAGAIGMSSTRSRVLRLLALRDKPITKLSRGWRWAAIPAMVSLVAVVALAQKNEPDTLEDKVRPDAGGAGSTEPASESKPARLPVYVIEPPDVLLIDMIRGVPKGPVLIAPLDTLGINVAGTLLGQDIQGQFSVDTDGNVMLGPAYGAVKVEGLTRQEAQDAVVKHLRRIVSQPEVALTILERPPSQQINGEHLVSIDGYVNLGIYGNAYVSGLTIAEARAAIEKQLSQSFRDPVVSVDVFAYNSKVYYVIQEGDDETSGVTRIPITGIVTVLDAIAQVKGLKNLSKAEIFITRPGPGGAKDKEKKLVVDWRKITRGADSSTNYQILPGDRLFIVQAEKKKP